MASYPAGFRVAQAIGISGAAWLSGNIAALSMNVTPALLQSWQEDNIPLTFLVKQWRNIYENGKSQNPPIAAAAGISFVYLAWSVRCRAPQSKPTLLNRSALFSAAAVLVIGIIPYTILTMSTVNNSLLQKALSTSELVEAETASLIERWTTLNTLRSILPLAGAICGILASLL
ncbi:DUF1772-domain-containing protein [Penicillium macrosclerotiorum]|uniref:DUF1772-domain-containing protein n=1 Tax=Penicillium macrosclerotiorum TaxID=303699 RepID=UPI0025466A4C|nr:DUF1772-domain-containing protein [Penicillium macrosclerotiorum]KAJ5673877.1 DUF1772-domain-containing protein [Penicillium macrosclerotiorum]